MKAFRPSNVELTSIKKRKYLRSLARSSFATKCQNLDDPIAREKRILKYCMIVDRGGKLEDLPEWQEFHKEYFNEY